MGENRAAGPWACLRSSMPFRSRSSGLESRDPAQLTRPGTALHEGTGPPRPQATVRTPCQTANRPPCHTAGHDKPCDQQMLPEGPAGPCLIEMPVVSAPQTPNRDAGSAPYGNATFLPGYARPLAISHGVPVSCPATTILQQAARLPHTACVPAEPLPLGWRFVVRAHAPSAAPGIQPHI